MSRRHLDDRVYSIIIAVHPDTPKEQNDEESLIETDHDHDQSCPRVGAIEVDWVDFTREKSFDKSSAGESSLASTAGTSEAMSRGSGSTSTSTSTSTRPAASSSSSGVRRKKASLQSPSELSLQPLLGHLPGQTQTHGPHPLETSVASGLTTVGRGVIHLFRHAPPASLIASLDAHPVGESSKAGKTGLGAKSSKNKHNKQEQVEDEDEWAGQRAEGEDGSLVAILAVPAWMRPADFLEFIGGWGTCLEGVRMIREATTPNRSIVLLKFRDPLQASDFLVIFTGRAFSTLDPRETCHPIRIHHLVLHKLDSRSSSSSSASTPVPVPVPAFPPSVYSSRASALAKLLPDVDKESLYELPSCPVCLERLDSSVTGLVTLPCAHTFDCDCLRKWGDSRCPVCRVSHLLLSAHAAGGRSSTSALGGQDVTPTRITRCASCDATEQNWICVVCGVVGCGRYDPGKGHARRHWEESGHVLAMELETQRVWDYKGDNYVHRLIQSRTDGKLVELPSASSLITPSHPSRTLPLGGQRTTPHTPTRAGTHSHNHTDANTRSRNATNGIETPGHTPSGSFDSTHPLHNTGEGHAGPSSGDVEKMSTIEAITLEYSYLLSSQLEAMRQHYETQQIAQSTRIAELEAASAALAAKEALAIEAAVAKEKAERKAAKALELFKTLSRELESERALASGLSTRVKSLQERLDGREEEVRERMDEVRGLEETVRDLMFSLEAGAQIRREGEEAVGGDLILGPRGGAAAGGGGGGGAKKKGKK